jgi:nitrate/TMAO reductase-like tetraheme cytochrome c subunit
VHQPKKFEPTAKREGQVGGTSRQIWFLFMDVDGSNKVRRIVSIAPLLGVVSKLCGSVCFAVVVAARSIHELVSSCHEMRSMFDVMSQSASKTYK